MDVHPYKLRIDGAVRYVLWYTNGVDGVLLDEGGHILNFDDMASTTADLLSRGLSIKPESYELLDLDWIANEPITSTGLIDCSRTLAAWNLFADVAASLPDQANDFLSKDLKPSRTYDKLFWGNNLPAVVPKGEHYEPEWSDAEIEEISSILVSGLALLKSNLC